MHNDRTQQIAQFYDDAPQQEWDRLGEGIIEYDLTAALTPGRHRLTMRVDNTLKYDMGANAHSTSEQTQTNWNGVIGRIELRATDPVWVDGVQVYPDVAGKAARTPG